LRIAEEGLRNIRRMTGLVTCFGAIDAHDSNRSSGK
jgi:hypothetical protein